MGLAVLPSRLKEELALLGDALVNGTNIENDPVLSKHAPWAKELLVKYWDINVWNVNDILKREVGLVFSKVLEHAGVYKRTEEGIKAFKKFAQSVK